jgi:hypothetical protein
MMTRAGVCLGLLALAALSAGAQSPERPPAERPPVDPVPKEWQFLGYSFTRTTASNVAPTDDILQGQVIGRLFGPNSTNTSDRVSLYTEQRFVPMLIYRPKVLDGFATFRGLFKIDYTWGDQDYGVGGNRGGAISGGQVNLQTLLANVEIKPPDADWNAVIGLQRVFDNAYDPNVNTVQMAQTSGYKLSYWGTQAVGVSVFVKPMAGTQVRTGVFQLWENEIASNDDVVLTMVDLDTRVAPTLELGADLWWVRDRANGAGGVSVLGQGLNSALADYNGATRLRFPSSVTRYKGDIVWLGGRAAYNRDFLAGRWWLDGYAMLNAVVVDTIGAGRGRAADGIGAAFNTAVQYRYGTTAQDRVSLEALVTTGDGNGANDGTVTSVVTGNVYGSPVGIYSAHRSFLLFPDPQVVNRYYAAVQDIGNLGLGVSAVFASAQRDFIPNRFSGRLGAATALSNNKVSGGGADIGTEINAELRYNLRVFLTATVSAAWMHLGSFYDAPGATYSRARPSDDPWVLFSTLTWTMF